MLVGCATVTVSTAAATAAATAVADVPLNGLLALNSRHLAPNTVIIFDIGILGFFLAMRGLCESRGRDSSRLVGFALLLLQLLLQPEAPASAALLDTQHGGEWSGHSWR